MTEKKKASEAKAAGTRKKPSSRKTAAASEQSSAKTSAKTKKTAKESETTSGRRSTAPSEAGPQGQVQETSTPKQRKVITAEERWNMIAENAYYRAEQRGFVGGSPAEDWSAAEAEIDAQLAQSDTVIEEG